jgi:hypothetical protein
MSHNQIRQTASGEYFQTQSYLIAFVCIRVETCGGTDGTQIILCSFDVFYFHSEKQPLLILKGIGSNNTGLNNLLNFVLTFIIKVQISAIVSQ